MIIFYFDEFISKPKFIQSTFALISLKHLGKAKLFI